MFSFMAPPIEASTAASRQSRNPGRACIRHAAVAAICLLAALPTSAENWVTFGSNVTASAAIDMDSVRPAESLADRLGAWLRRDVLQRSRERPGSIEGELWRVLRAAYPDRFERP
jgi:hypothetical protein